MDFMTPKHHQIEQPKKTEQKQDPLHFQYKVDPQTHHQTTHDEHPHHQTTVHEPVDVTHEALYQEHIYHGMPYQPYTAMPPYPPPGVLYPFYGGYMDDHQTIHRTADEQRAYMAHAMSDPYHFEDERLDMDLIVPALGSPDEYTHPYAGYSHQPMDIAHSPDHYSNSKSYDFYGHPYEQHRSYNGQQEDTIPYVFGSPHHGKPQKHHVTPTVAEKTSSKSQSDSKSGSKSAKKEDIGTLHAAQAE